MFWTRELLAKISKIISDAHAAVSVTLYGPKTVDPDVLADLREQGLIPKTPAGNTSVKTAYEYGMAMSRGDEVEGMGPEEFAEHVEEHPLELGPYERQAIEVAEARAGQYCQGLGNKVNLETGAVAIEADGRLRSRMRAAIKDATVQRIAKRNSIKEMVSDLGWETGDWTRDLARIANTESMTAMQEGVADQLNQRGPGQRAAKIPSPNCCDRCRALFVGQDGKPIIFDLAELERNGTNVGRKTAQWRPVIGTVHPNCGCMLVAVPAGFEFDDDGNLKPIGAPATPPPGTRSRKSLTLHKAGEQNILTPYGGMASPAGDRNPGGSRGGTAAALLITPPGKPGPLVPLSRQGRKLDAKKVLLGGHENTPRPLPREDLRVPQAPLPIVTDPTKVAINNIPDTKRAASTKRAVLQRMGRQVCDETLPEAVPQAQDPDSRKKRRIRKPMV